MDQSERLTSITAGPSQHDWEFHRLEITRLYRDENRTLQDVREIMSANGFVASLPMYKKKLKKWGVEKNMKTADILTVVRAIKVRKEQGKSSKVEIRGRHVPINEVQKRAKRAQMWDVEVEEDVDMELSAGDVQIGTPGASPECSLATEAIPTKRRRISRRLGTSKCSLRLTRLDDIGHDAENSVVFSKRVQDLEGMAVDVLCASNLEHVLFDPDLDFGLSNDDILPCWDPNQETLIWLQICLQEYQTPTATSKIIKYLHTIVISRDYGLMVPDEFGPSFSETSPTKIRAALENVDKSTILCFFGVILSFQQEKYESMVVSFLQQAYDIAKERLCNQHPLLRLFSKLSNTVSEQFLEEAILDIIKSLSAPTVMLQDRRDKHQRFLIERVASWFQAAKICVISIADWKSVHQTYKTAPSVWIIYAQRCIVPWN